MNRGNVKIQFENVTSSSKTLTPSSAKSNSEHDSLVVDGSNGSPRIKDVRFIVEKFKFEFEDDGCEGTYDLHATKADFDTTTINGVNVTAGNVDSIDITLTDN